MPELPEVETIRRGLAPFLEGATFASVEQRRPDLRFPFPARFAERLKGQRVVRLGRRAKYLLVEMESGLVLAIHLGMTGRFSILPPKGEGHAPGAFYYDQPPLPQHDHVIFRLSDGGRVCYNDVRRFGYMTLIEPGEFAAHALFRGLGVEPLSDELSAGFLRGKARGKMQPLKNFLMDQRVIAGLGNIYVCEALFRAGLSPFAEAGSLAGQGKNAPQAAQGLAQAIKAVLEEAIEAGGSSLRDYRQANGASGQFQEKFRVYGREGLDCMNGCGSVIQRVTQQGRSTFFCPVCQGVAASNGKGKA